MTFVSAIAGKWIPVIVALAVLMPVAAQTRLEAGLAEYSRQTDPVRKARALAKLSNAQIDLAQKQLKAGEDVASLQTLQTYLGEVQHTAAALIATGADAEKRPGGFKELQISVRESVRRVDDLILTLPTDKRPFFRDVRTDLVTVQNELIDALFPRQPSPNAKRPDP